MKQIILLLSTLLLFFSPNLSKAQWSIGPHVVISFPTSDFANVSSTGGGFGVKVIRKMPSLGGLELRGDFAFLSYGRDIDIISDQFGRDFPADITHESFRLTVGPNYSFGSRNFRVHFGGLGGFYYYRTNVNISTNFGFFQDSRENDFALGWNIGGGFQYDIGLGPWLDVALRYQTIYGVSQEIDARNDLGEEVKISRDITANEFTLKIGIIFFLGK
ncbi:MAG: hypothetical protein ACE5HS_11660 [bacterium]